VRRALNLAIDRYTAGKVLYALTGLRDVGRHPAGHRWAMAPAELEKFAASAGPREEPRGGQAAPGGSGLPDGFKLGLKNRKRQAAVPGLGGLRDPGNGARSESRPSIGRSRRQPGTRDGRDQGLRSDRHSDRHTPSTIPTRCSRRSSPGLLRLGRFLNPAIDDLFARQTRTLDPIERPEAGRRASEVVLENAYHIPGLWWSRNVVHWTKVKNWIAPPVTHEPEAPGRLASRMICDALTRFQRSRAVVRSASCSASCSRPARPRRAAGQETRVAAGFAGRHRGRRTEARSAPGADLRHHPAGRAALQHADPDGSLELSEDHRRRRQRVEDRADGLTYSSRSVRDQVSRRLALTAADVKATYDKIIFPPASVRSIRKNTYTAVASVEAPDPNTGVFKLKFPSASLLGNLGVAVDVIYPKKYLDKDPNYSKSNVVGVGAVQIQELHARIDVRRERTPTTSSRTGVPRRLQVLHQHGNLGARRGGSGPAGPTSSSAPSRWRKWSRSRSRLGDKVVVQDTARHRLVRDRDEPDAKPFTDIRVARRSRGIDRYTAGRGPVSDRESPRPGA